MALNIKCSPHQISQLILFRTSYLTIVIVMVPIRSHWRPGYQFCEHSPSHTYMAVHSSAAFIALAAIHTTILVLAGHKLAASLGHTG